MYCDSHGRCFFCLECICGFRAEGWDLMWQSAEGWDVMLQSAVCGPCLKRVTREQQTVFGPRGHSIYDYVYEGDWGMIEAREWAVKREKGVKP